MVLGLIFLKFFFFHMVNIGSIEFNNIPYNDHFVN